MEKKSPFFVVLIPTNESDGSSKERVEVAASSINIGLQSNPVSSFGQATVENSFPYHNLQRQEGVQIDSMGLNESLNTPSIQQSKGVFFLTALEMWSTSPEHLREQWEVSDQVTVKSIGWIFWAPVYWLRMWQHPGVLMWWQHPDFGPLPNTTQWLLID